MKKICCMPSCEKLAWARGWCRMHYMRWWVHGNPSTVLKRQSAAGISEAFLTQTMDYEGNKCIFWPFTKNNKGYPQINRRGQKFLVHRLVCKANIGDPPSAEHEAAHCCGNGHLGCITPSHIRWATRSENAADMVQHGRSTRGLSSKLASVQVLEIFRRAWNEGSQWQIAAEFNITQTAVSRIKLGKIWGWLTKQTSGRAA